MATSAERNNAKLRQPVRTEFRLSSNAHGSPAVVVAGNAAFGLFVLCGSATVRAGRPGWVSEWIASNYCDSKRWKQQAQRLVEAGLWKRVAGGWEMIPDPAGVRRPIFKFVPVYWREPIPAHLRKRVMERDGYACTECGDTNDLTLDHIYPWSKGGPDSYGNLRVLCRPCNSSKGARV